MTKHNVFTVKIMNEDKELLHMVNLDTGSIPFLKGDKVIVESKVYEVVNIVPEMKSRKYNYLTYHLVVRHCSRTTPDDLMYKNVGKKGGKK